MKTPFPREGVLAALSLPFDRDGRLKEAALAAHLGWLRERGIHGVLALGSTGEFPFLSLEQRKEVLATVASMAGPLPVVANISDIRPDVVAGLGRFACELGLAGVAVMPPHFFPVAPADQLAFFEHAAQAAGGLPVLLYNFPELTGNRISLETIAAFADCAPMAGIKQSGAEFGYHDALIALGREKGFSVFSGADTRLPEVFGLGASGCIGGLVNLVPEYMVEQFRVFRRGEPGVLEPVASRMRQVGAIIDRLKFPLNVAAGLAARGFDPGTPKSIVSAETGRVYSAVVGELRRCFREWGLETFAHGDAAA